MLGILLDCKLTLQPCVEAILQKSRPKIRALLKLKNLYSISELLNLYKTHVWGYSEYPNGAIIQASWSQLKRIDKMQRWFLHELDITDTNAFILFNFAPPSLRRRIGLLGMMHKRVLGHCHPLLRSAFPFDDQVEARYHSKMLKSHFEEVRGNRRMYDNSIYLYVLMYNRLSEDMVRLPSVKAFQAKLTHLAKEQAKRDEAHWRDCYANCGEVVRMFHT